jgi:hypothetical protein
MKYFLAFLLAMCIAGCSKNDEISIKNDDSVINQENSAQKTNDNNLVAKNENLEKKHSYHFINCENPPDEKINFVCNDQMMKSGRFADSLNETYEMAIKSNCQTEADIIVKNILERFSSCPLDHSCFLGVQMQQGGELAHLAGFCAGLNR